jgi:lipopolysaccharide transport system ATP-binding protein
MEFRNRCYTRMDKMRKDGVTMIMVSHNLNEVRNLCENTIMLFKGQTLMEGPTQKVLERYHQTISEKLRVEQEKEEALQAAKHQGSPFLITGTQLLNADGHPSETFSTGQGMTLRISYLARQRIEKPAFRVEMVWATDDFLATVYSTDFDKAPLGALEGAGTIDLNIDALLVEPNVYMLRVLACDGPATYDTAPRVRFVVAEEIPIPGVFCMKHSWGRPQALPRSAAAIDTATAPAVATDALKTSSASAQVSV